jgi:hypothetical protein
MEIRMSSKSAAISGAVVVIALVVVGLVSRSGHAINASAGATTSSTSADANPAPSSGDLGPMKTVEINDPMFNMPVGSLSIPKDWNFEGTVLHGPGCQGLLTDVVYRIYSPDMLYGIQQIPTASFYWADDARARPHAATCKLLQPVSAENYGRLIAVRIRPGAVVDSVVVDPSNATLQASLEKNTQALATQAASMGMRNHAKMSGEVKQLHIHYDLSGHPEEELLRVAMTVTDQPVSTIVSKPGQVMQTAWESMIVSSPSVTGTRAPKGQMASHGDVLDAIVKSYKPNPAWAPAVAKYMQDATNRSIQASWAITNSILQKGAQEQAQRTQQAQAFIQNMQQQGDARRDEFNASMAQRSGHAADVSDYLLDQQLFVNPTTGQTQTQSNQYNHTFSNGSGAGSAVVQTNDPNANPNGVLQGNWTELQPIHH